MLKQSIIGTTFFALSLLFPIGHAVGQEVPDPSAVKTEHAAPNGAVKPQKTDAADSTSALDEQDAKMVETAKQFSEACTKVLQKWIDSKEISKEKLFSYLYYPIKDTNPAKFSTDYDQLSDRDIQSILEKYLTARPDTIYAVISDKNGYIPTHNLKYSQKLTGDWAKDLVGNRTKRIFADKTGLAASRNQLPYLIQNYKRDTGQIMVDLSVPIYVSGTHWGCIRIGYHKNR